MQIFETDKAKSLALSLLVLRTCASFALENNFVWITEYLILAVDWNLLIFNHTLSFTLHFPSIYMLI